MTKKKIKMKNIKEQLKQTVPQKCSNLVRPKNKMQLVKQVHKKPRTRKKRMHSQSKEDNFKCNEKQLNNNQQDRTKRKLQKKRKKKRKQFERLNADNNNIKYLLCFLCKTFLVSTAQVKCGHSFCEVCIVEYFLFKANCPVCSVQIRYQGYTRNRNMDDIIQQFLGTIKGERQQVYQQKIKQIKKYKQQYKLTVFDVGSNIDIMDQHYRWRKGIITRIFAQRIDDDDLGQQRRIGNQIKINYLDQDKSERLQLSSMRLAKEGFYTNRQDLKQFYQKQNSTIKKYKIDRIRVNLQ